MSVWKVGTRWGNQGPSVFNLFLDYGVVFVGGTSDGLRQGDYSAVKEGDLFLIADGATPVAIGVAKSRFLPWESSGVLLRAKDRGDFFDDETLVCKTEIKLLDEPKSWSFDIQKRFCRNNASSKEVENHWNELLDEDDQGRFDIKSRTVSLFPMGTADDSVFNPNIRYRIPIYQRAYSWGTQEIDRLFQDLTKGVKDKDVLFMGTMQVSAPFPLDVKNKIVRYDVIDGQQRITTFLLLAGMLERMGYLHSSVLTADSVLRTLVNKGEAQKDLDEFLQADLEIIQQSEACTNIYLRNASYVLLKVNELFSGQDGDPTLQALKDFLLKSVRLVVIETRAGISKTIQIFNVINTTGLDLNGSDIFKVRFFEFLTDKRGEAQEVFDKISGLYGEIEHRNKTHGYAVASMQEILTALQALIIAKYDLSNVLFDYATDRFFEQLLDALLGVNTWKHFDSNQLQAIEEDNSSDSPLSIQGIHKLIECRYKFHLRYGQDACEFKDVALTRFMEQSRYGWRYWYYPVIFMYQCGNEELSEYYSALVQLSLCYSLIHSRVVYAAHGCIRKSLKALFSSDDSSIRILKDQRNELRDATRNAIYDKELAFNPKWKLIVCRLSEYLEHADSFKQSTPKLIGNIFYEQVDIEHIQAANDKDGMRREKVCNEWGSILNGVGNLVMLEYRINRSISNEPFDQKKTGYKKSCYRTVEALLKFEDWELEECETRRKHETEKLMTWLFQER